MNGLPDHHVRPAPWRPAGSPGVHAAAAGLLLTFTLPPFAWTGLLAPAALALFFGALCASGRPGRTGWIFGLVHQAGVLHWLFFLDASKSIPTRALVPIQAVAAMLYVSLFYLALGWVFGRLRRAAPARLDLALLPPLWVGMEALRARGELGFPWCTSGSALIGTPLLPLGSACGEIGLSAGIALAATLILALARRRSRAALIHLTAGAVLWWLYLAAGAAVSAPRHEGAYAGGPDSLTVAAVQPDVALADKWVAAKIDSTTIPHERLTLGAAAAGAELIVWSETAVPAYLRLDGGLLQWMRDVVRRSGAYVFTGFPDAERLPTGKVLTYNASGLFAPDGTLRDQYAKHHLLPIGEAMPFTRYFPFLADIDVGQAEWAPGAAPAPIALGDRPGAFRFSALICFESIFPELARRAVRQGSRCLVVITNDGWFGRSAGPRQHAWLARLRAVECGVPLVRSANNGISFICDARGRVLDSLGLGRRGFVLARILPGRGETLFVRAGAWPLLGFLAAWAAAGWLTLRGPRRGAEGA